MVGIYKITNKLNGKSYIGQSVHCGKRFDEHLHGNLLIDETIQIEGIENFTFEILKLSTKEELSYWEDYYIKQFNTFFPKGYNKKWNTSAAKKEKITDKTLQSFEKEKVLSEVNFYNSEIVKRL